MIVGFSDMVESGKVTDTSTSFSEQHEAPKASATSHDALPPDGGYGWLVVACASFGLFIMTGTLNTFGLLYPYLASTFQAGDIYVVAIYTASWCCLCCIGKGLAIYIIV